MVSIPKLKGVRGKEEKSGRGEKKQERVTFLTGIFQIAYLTTCDFPNASVGKPPDPQWGKIPHF